MDYEALNQAQVVADHDPFTAERYRQFASHLPAACTTVLDVGCGNGRGGYALKHVRPDLRIHGLDCVRSRLALLPADVYEAAVCSLSSQIDLPDQSMDAIVAGEFIEHLTAEDAITSLAEFHRVLKPTGVLLLTTPNPEYVRLALTGGSVLGGAHLSQHYARDLSALLARLGFREIQLRGSGKVSRILGERFPVLRLYGSYLVRAERGQSTVQGSPA